MPHHQWNMKNTSQVMCGLRQNFKVRKGEIRVASRTACIKTTWRPAEPRLGPISKVCNSVGLEVSPRIRLSNKCPGDADSAH